MKGKEKGNLDKNVIYTFIITSLFALVISGYKLSSGEKCTNASFVITETEIEAGKVLHFVDNNPRSGNWEWSFGDSTEIVREQNPLHIYRFAGTYPVRLKVDNSCEVIKMITVKSRRIDSAGYPTFVAPLKAMVGEKVRFFDTTRNATSWEWRFGESFDKTSRQRDPVYVYSTPGIKNVILVVNGQNKYYTKKQVMVLPKPIVKAESVIPPPLPKRPKVQPREEPQMPIAPQVVSPPPVIEEPVVQVKPTVPKHVPVPAVNLAPEITHEALKELLLQIESKKKRLEDLAPYVCENYSVPVLMTNVRNAASKTLSLRDFCKNLKGLKITDVYMEKDPNTRCVSSFKISYKYSDW